jgi:hypothetical protein
VCVHTDKGEYFYINGKYRHVIVGHRILNSWSFLFIIESSECALVKYPRASPLGFRDGSLVTDVSDGKTYFISQRQRRPVQTPDFFRYVGLKPKDAILVSKEEVSLHKEGEALK